PVGGEERLALRDEVVATVAVFYGDDFALFAEVIYVLKQNDFHNNLGFAASVRPHVFTKRSGGLAYGVGHEREQGQVAGPLDGARKLALGLGRDAGDAARQELALLVHEALQKFGVFVVDVFAFDLRHDRVLV